MTVPGTLVAGGWAGYSGTVSFYRRFGKPSNLGTADRVRLAFDRVTGAAEVSLNGEPLGPLSESGTFDVTDRLYERNALEVVVEATDDGCGIVGDVAVEILASEAS
jgi:hypothetical protein